MLGISLDELVQQTLDAMKSLVDTLHIWGKGGASFVLLYILFLVILGLPIVVMEFAVGRASQRSIALSFNILESKGTK